MAYLFDFAYIFSPKLLFVSQLRGCASLPLQEVVSRGELVDGTQYQAIEYTRLVPMLVESVKALGDQIDELRATHDRSEDAWRLRTEALENKVNSLVRKLAASD